MSVRASSQSGTPVVFKSTSYVLKAGTRFSWSVFRRSEDVGELVHPLFPRVAPRCCPLIRLCSLNPDVLFAVQVGGQRMWDVRLFTPREWDHSRGPWVCVRFLVISFPFALFGSSCSSPCFNLLWFAVMCFGVIRCSPVCCITLPCHVIGCRCCCCSALAFHRVRTSSRVEFSLGVQRQRETNS